MRWEDPPERSRHGGPKVQWIDEVTELKKNPKRWALLTMLRLEQAGTASQMVSEIRKGRRVAFRPAGAFEATQHKTETGIKIFVRYVGEE